MPRLGGSTASPSVLADFRRLGRGGGDPPPALSWRCSTSFHDGLRRRERASETLSCPYKPVAAKKSPTRRSARRRARRLVLAEVARRLNDLARHGGLSGPSSGARGGRAPRQMLTCRARASVLLVAAAGRQRSSTGLSTASKKVRRPDEGRECVYPARAWRGCATPSAEQAARAADDRRGSVRRPSSTSRACRSS